MAAEIPVFKKVGSRIILIGVISQQPKVARDNPESVVELRMPFYGNSGNGAGMRKSAALAVGSFELDREFKSDRRRGKEREPKRKVIENRRRRYARRLKQDLINDDDIQE